MHHLCAYTTSAVLTTANTDVPALTDDYLTITNSHFLMRENMQVLAASAMSAGMARARLVAPSVRSITTPFLNPIEPAVIPTDMPGICDMRERPFAINADEELAFEVTGTTACAERVTVLAWLQTMFRPAPPGPIYTLRGTSTTAATANVWSTLAMTWQDTPERGRYALVGLRVESTNAQAARLIIPGQDMRPGSMSAPTASLQQHRMFDNCGLGEWGQFVSPIMPSVQVLANAANNSHVVYLSFIPIGRA